MFGAGLARTVVSESLDAICSCSVVYPLWVLNQSSVDLRSARS